jgi:hypothetical protein
VRGFKAAIASVIICATVALIGSFPAQWAVKIAAPNVLPSGAIISGSVWSGQVTGLPFSGFVDYRVWPKNLFGEKPVLTLESHVPGLNIKAKARFKKLQSLTATGRIDTFAHVNPQLAGMMGSFDLRISGLSFDKTCALNEGFVRTDVLTKNQNLWHWSGPSLSGPVSCAGQELVVNLSGDDGNTAVEAILRITLGGVYNNDITVKSRDDNLGILLSLYGFEKTANGYSLRETGKWR